MLLKVGRMCELDGSGEICDLTVATKHGVLPEEMLLVFVPISIVSYSGLMQLKKNKKKTI